MRNVTKVRSRGKHFHIKLQYHFVGAVCYNIEQGLRHVSISGVFQGSLLLVISVCWLCLYCHSSSLSQYAYM